MNIFAVDLCPELAAKCLNDKHVVKMPTESAQILSTVVWKLNGYDLGYSPTHVNHPCTIWASKSRSNFIWLIRHAEALLDEHVFRYGNKKHHNVRRIIQCAKQVVHNLSFEHDALTPFAQGFKGNYSSLMSENPVLGYRAYYKVAKAYMGWNKSRQAPSWLRDVRSGCPSFKSEVISLDF